ncbi:SETMR methyltransferase, partial [Acromyrmex charruanus]
MEKNEFRTVIKHLHIKGLTPKEIKAELDNVHSTSVPAFATVYNWVNEFKRGRTSTCDASPIETATPEIIDKVHDIVLTDRRVPRLLTVNHKRDHVTISKQCLEMFQRNPDEFLHRFITVDETWITLHSRRTVKTIDSPSKLAPKKAKSDAMAKFNEFHYELLPHPAYSPDLVPCDYFLFPNLKKWFGGKRFTTREQLIAETEAYFEGLDKSYYSDGLKKLENRWIKYIELKGDYIEK